MATTQTRIGTDTLARLVRLAAQTGKDRQLLLDMAIRRLERELFLESVNQGFKKLREDPEAWAEELEERADWDAISLNREDD